MSHRQDMLGFNYQLYSHLIRAEKSFYRQILDADIDMNQIDGIQKFEEALNVSYFALLLINTLFAVTCENNQKKL